MLTSMAFKNLLRAGVCSLGLAITLFAHGEAVEVDHSSSWLEEGKETLDPFKKQLIHALTVGLKSGVAEAISACQTKAPVITSERSGESIRVGRTSHKIRNPKNAPTAWLESVLQSYLNESEKSGPTSIKLATGEIAYVEPIYLKPMCLSCHGAKLASDVEAKLTELYPDDDATGFDVGEFRGLFWATFIDNTAIDNTTPTRSH